MFHILLVIISYVVFIALIYDMKTKRDGGLSIEPSVLLLFSVVHILLLTVVYEQLLMHILLHKVDSYGGYISFAAVGSGVYMIFYFAGLMIIGKLTGCPLPNLWTLIVFIISLAVNVLLITKATNIYYDEMIRNFSETVFTDFYKSLSGTTRPALANTLLNLKWLVMIIPGVVYLIQILKNKKNDEQI